MRARRMTNSRSLARAIRVDVRIKPATSGERYHTRNVIEHDQLGHKMTHPYVRRASWARSRQHPNRWQNANTASKQHQIRDTPSAFSMAESITARRELGKIIVKRHYNPTAWKSTGKVSIMPRDGDNADKRVDIYGNAQTFLTKCQKTSNQQTHITGAA